LLSITTTFNFVWGGQYSVTGLTRDVFSQRTFSCRTRAHDC